MARGQSRRRRKRTLSPRFIVVCEGRKTEYEYLTRLTQAIKPRQTVAVCPLRGGGLDAVGIVEKAIRQREEDRRNLKFDRRQGDMAFVLTDVEPHDPRKADRLQAALQLAEKEDVCVLLSNPCFEFWLFCHAASRQEACRAFRNPELLDKELQQRLGFNKDALHSNPNLFDALLNNVDQAVRVAQYVHRKHHGNVEDIRQANACTTVYQLVERMIGV